MQHILDYKVDCTNCSDSISVKNSYKIGEKYYCIPCGFVQDICRGDHPYMTKQEIPEFSGEYFDVCEECGMIDEKVDP